jgi:two-component system chemotaxis response regulator CheB
MARIKVLLADDSQTVLNALSALLKDEPDIEVVGRASDGVEAVSLAKALRPDVVTMDVMMPRLDGLGATAAIMAEAPARVLIVSSITESQQMDLSFRAIEAGALELISKPKGSGVDELRKWGRRVAESIRLMAEVPVITRRRLSSLPAYVPQVRTPVDVFGLVASTGGPPALALLLGALPAGLPVPILIAQHITEGFTSGLVRWLASVSPLKVGIAQEGRACMPGEVYLPPDGHHLEVDAEGLIRCPKWTGEGHCPSGDRLLSTLARAYGGRAAGVVLTGMGEDGAQGLLAIKNAGGQTFAQDATTSVVFGMPQAAFQLKATQTLLPLEAMAPIIRELAERPASWPSAPPL